MLLSLWRETVISHGLADYMWKEQKNKMQLTGIWLSNTWSMNPLKYMFCKLFMFFSDSLFGHKAWENKVNFLLLLAFLNGSIQYQGTRDMCY